MGNKIIKLNTSSSSASSKEAPRQDVYVDISMVSKPNNNNEPHLTYKKYKPFVMLAQEHPFTRAAQDLVLTACEKEIIKLYYGIKLSIRYMFARGIWCNVKTTISKLFNGKYFKDIDYAFLNTLGTMKSSDATNKRRIIDNGAVITDGSTSAVLPHLEVFAVATKYVPTKVTQTYYGSIYEADRKSIYTIGSTDVVRNTWSSNVAVTPTV